MLKIGERLRRPDGSTITLSTREYIESEAPVFNFEVENAHTYFVGNSHKNAVLAHNACPYCNDTGMRTIYEKGYSGFWNWIYGNVEGIPRKIPCRLCMHPLNPDVQETMPAPHKPMQESNSRPDTRSDGYLANVGMVFKGMFWTGPKNMAVGAWDAVSHPIDTANVVYWGTGEMIYHTSIAVGETAVDLYDDPSGTSKRLVNQALDAAINKGNAYLDSPESAGEDYFKISAAAVGAKMAASIVMDVSKQAANIVNESGVAIRKADIGRKLDYVFGKSKVTEDGHNITRSIGTLKALERIGFLDNAENRSFLAKHLNDVLQATDNVKEIQDKGRILKESLLMGRFGAVKLESIWEGDKLITIMTKGGR